MRIRDNTMTAKELRVEIRHIAKGRNKNAAMGSKPRRKPRQIAGISILPR
ncbi:MAG: hypothetical protein A4E66_02657 [Syntrophus sp. PtaB.Bin001]|nr:MAG: hypothetical protein A4E66_02657 [Syntrophus sp. PtaB.Bin001]